MKSADAACEGNVFIPVSLHACEEAGIGIQRSLHFPREFVLVSLRTGYLLTPHRVRSFEQAVFWLDALLQESEQWQCDWKKSKDRYDALPDDVRKQYRGVLIRTWNKAILL